MIDERLQQHFWLSEFLRSDLAERNGIDNRPTPEALANIRTVLAPGMQRVRNALGEPMHVTSGYRSPALNAAVRGSASSQHMQGLAADFVCSEFGTPRGVAMYLAERMGDMRIDQLVLEGSWVHVSFVPGAPRLQVLTARFVGGQARYTPGIN